MGCDDDDDDDDPIGRSAKYQKEVVGSKQRVEKRERAELGAYARNS